MSRDEAAPRKDREFAGNAREIGIRLHTWKVIPIPIPLSLVIISLRIIEENKIHHSLLHGYVKHKAIIQREIKIKNDLNEKNNSKMSVTEEKVIWKFKLRNLSLVPDMPSHLLRV